MIAGLRIRLARWILGDHCACYRMGYHPMVNTNQWIKEKQDERHKHSSQSSN
jgi:hypothetical protein